MRLSQHYIRMFWSDYICGGIDPDGPDTATACPDYLYFRYVTVRLGAKT